MQSTVNSEFLSISVATLHPQAVTGLSLYQRDTHSDEFVLYRDAEYPIKQDDLNRLKERGIKKLFIAKEERAVYQRYLREVALGADNDVSSEVRSGALAEIVRDVLESTFASDNVEKIVSSAEVLGHLASRLICDRAFTAFSLLSVLHHDYGTFTHSANVAFYAGILATELGYARDDVEKIVMGGLLHDLGKLGIDERILSKPGKLDDREFRIIRRHPIIGFARLCERDDLSHAQLMMVYQHHERTDGKGYPVGAVGSEIHPWAKLCSVVDVYEALTSHRPYRNAMSTATALGILHKDIDQAFDAEIVACWTNIIRTNLKP